MHHNKSFAFTLAEVLITLGIIGVVAAMTLPSLIAKHQEKQWVTAFLHTYSLLNNAYRMVQNENGTFEDWADVTITNTDGKPNRSSRANGAAIYNVMIKPYVQVNEAFLEAGNNSCIPEKSYQLNKEENPSFNVEMVNTHRPTVSLVSGECIVLGNDFGDLGGKGAFRDPYAGKTTGGYFVPVSGRIAGHDRSVRESRVFAGNDECAGGEIYISTYGVSTCSQKQSLECVLCNGAAFALVRSLRMGCRIFG